LDMDFFCQLSYMAAIATSGISRSGLFHHAASLPYLSARYFKKAEFVAKAFNHDYSEACRIVGETTKEPEVKSVLLRLSGALSSGEDITTFMERESQVFAESYSNSYERRLEVLRKWTDAYVALILWSPWLEPGSYTIMPPEKLRCIPCPTVPRSKIWQEVYPSFACLWVPSWQ